MPATKREKVRLATWSGASAAEVVMVEVVARVDIFYSFPLI